MGALQIGSLVTERLWDSIEAQVMKQVGAHALTWATVAGINGAMGQHCGARSWGRQDRTPWNGQQRMNGAVAQRCGTSHEAIECPPGLADVGCARPGLLSSSSKAEMTPYVQTSSLPGFSCLARPPASNWETNTRSVCNSPQASEFNFSSTPLFLFGAARMQLQPSGGWPAVCLCVDLRPVAVAVLAAAAAAAAPRGEWRCVYQHLCM